MLPRTRLTHLFTATLIAFLPLAASAAPVADPAEDNAEAQRLYDHANDYIKNIPEGDYSYAYIQFHWKRSQANIERILRVYPNTPTGRSLASGLLKLGDFDLSYFKDRVLSRLEEKRVAAYDAVNSAIFLYNFDEKRQDDTRRAALGRILEVLSRQQRWNEALKFPVLDTDKAFKAAAIFRVAARFEVEDIVKQILGTTPKANLPATNAILGEALALRGRTRTEITKLLDKSPEDVVKLGVLNGMIEREIAIQRAAAQRIATKNIILAGGSLQRPTVRDDIEAVAKIFFPTPTTASAELLDTFHAALGVRPAAKSAIAVHVAYLEYLGAFEKFDELENYLRSDTLPSTSRQPAELKAIELYAQAGRLADAERLRAPLVAAGGALSEASALAEFRGQINSTEVPLTVHPKTFSSLPINDTCVLAQAIMEWSLTPNRSIRGAAPYDSVVQKFLPGFANIPATKSAAVRDASSALKPY
jgi:hypothetical protein